MVDRTRYINDNNFITYLKHATSCFSHVYTNVTNNLIDDLSGKFGNLKVGPGGDAEGSFEIVDTIGQPTELQASSVSGTKISS